MVIEIGRLCVKTAGRDAMQYAIIIDKIDNNHVLIDGNVRRKKVNISHIEPLNKTVKIKKNADTKEVFNALNELGIEIKKHETPKPKKEKQPQIKKTEKKVTKKTTTKKKTIKKENKK